MPKLLSNPILLWIAIGALVLATMFRHRPKPLLDEATRTELTALRSSKMQDERLIASLKDSALAANARATSMQSRLLTIGRATSVIGQRADAIAAAARAAEQQHQHESSPGDQPDTTARLWRSAYEARTEEVDSLRRAARIRDSIESEQRRAILGFQTALDSSESRRQRLEAINTTLSKAVEKAERGCRVPLTLGLVPCLTRGQSFAAGGVVGATLGLYFATR